jgi:hypothetical protein
VNDLNVLGQPRHPTASEIVVAQYLWHRSARRLFDFGHKKKKWEQVFSITLTNRPMRGLRPCAPLYGGLS